VEWRHGAGAVAVSPNCRRVELRALGRSTPGDFVAGGACARARRARARMGAAGISAIPLHDRLIGLSTVSPRHCASRAPLMALAVWAVPALYARH
jgi:hypothetical protein